MVDLVNKIFKLRWFPTAVAFAVVMAVVVAFCWPVMFGGRTLFHTHLEYPHTDETSVHLPLHAEVSRQRSIGEMPLFNQWPAFGLPLAADPDALVFDPFMAIFRGAGPASEVLSWRSIVLGAAGAMAIFGFLWLFGVSLAGSIAGAAVYASLVLRYPTAEELLIHYAGTDWSIIGIFLLAVAIRKREAWAFPLAGVATGFAALSGHPQGAYFGLALGALYIFGEAWPRRGQDSRYPLLGGLGWLAIALAVASMQLLPLAANIESSLHVFADPSRPEFDENLVGYALAILGPGAAVFFVLPLRRRWIEAWVFVLMALFVLTIMNTPIVRFWQAVVPLFDHFKLSSKYFVSPFPILASVGLGLGIGVVSQWSGMPGRAGLFVCGVLALWPVWSAPYQIVYRLQQPAAEVERLDPVCLADIRESTPRFGRMVRFDTEAMYPSQTVTARLFDVQVLASSLPARYADLMTAMTPEHATAIRQDSNARSISDPAVLELAFWDVAGVTTLVSGRPVEIPGWALQTSRPDGTCMTGTPGYWIYRNRQALPRAFLHDGPDTPDGVREGLEFVMDRATPTPILAPGAVEISEYSGSRVVIDVDSQSPARLVLTDAMLDGWRVTVDGAPAAANRTWYLFRSVPVPSGRHRVVWEYRPLVVTVGLIVGGIGVVAAAIWAITAAFVLPWRRRKFPGPGSAASPDSAQEHI